jgi:hypothetical protein
VELDDVVVGELVVVGDAEGRGVGLPADRVLQSGAQLVVDDVGEVLDGGAAAEDERAGHVGWSTWWLGVHPDNVECGDNALAQRVEAVASECRGLKQREAITKLQAEELGAVAGGRAI